MLKRLYIENVALIERAELEFSDKINVLSGETGAGKSIILDSIDFVLGAKADRSMIRSGEQSCLVRAEFSTTDPRVGDLLEELDIEAEEELILSRKLNIDGKGTLKINGISVTASMLRRLTALLVDVHGQSEHFFLLKEANQLRLLDEVAGEPVSKIKDALKELLSVRRTLLAERTKLGGDEDERNRRLDVLKFQIDEISSAQLREGEEEELLAFRERWRNAEKILEGLNSARQYLTSDGGSVDALRGAARSLSALSRFGEQYDSLAERLENAAAEAEDIADCAEQYADELDIDEHEAERVEARLDELKSLKRKYGGSVQEILSFLEKAKDEFELLSDSGARFEMLTGKLEKTDAAIYGACNALTDARKKAAEGFTKRVVEELKTLNIASARFEVQFDAFTREDVPKATSEGLGGVRFLFSANAGEPLKELGKIISGGEMSRFMLAVKAQLSSVNAIGTYIFDEIDAGIGGKTARTVAEKFCRIAKNVQIIAVSHLAQIASFADREFVIEKKEADGRTHTCIREADGDARVREIARLIGGDAENDAAIRHAEELLKSAESYKNSLS